MQRRKFLACSVGCITAIAGCAVLESEDDESDNGDSSGTGGSDGSSNSGSTTTREQLTDDRHSVNEDEWYRIAFDLNRQATLEYEFFVRDGPAIDVFVMNDLEYEEYQAGNRFQVFSSDNGTSGSDSVTLGEGTYRLVIDNTGAGSESPPTNFDDDVADVEVEATVVG